MNKLLPLIFSLLLLTSFTLKAEKFPIRHQQTFNDIYQSYPNIPVGLLEAIAFNNTRMRHITATQDSASCTGMPRYHGLMGLIDDGQGYFRSSLSKVAELSGYTTNEILTDPTINVLAYASALNSLMATKRFAAVISPTDFIPEIIALSELPLTDDIQNDFAINSDLYMIFTLMQNEEFRSIYNIPKYNYDLKELFGANYDVLSATRVNAIDGSIKSDEDNPYQNMQRRAVCAMTTGPIEYPVAIWNAADPSNYSDPSVVNTRETIAIHTIQGKYSGAISWFKNPSSNVSTQYVVRSYDGQVTQMACHTIKCWHVASQNVYAVGIEHEGYIDDGATWYSTELYASSADLVKFIANKEGVNLLQTYDGPPTDGIFTLSHTCHKIKGHQHFTGNGHTDPGPQWEWKRFYRLLNDLPAPTASTSATGTMYDSGGAGGNYANEERTTYLINPAGNDPIQLTFNSWDVEADWDYLWIYDGLDDTGALLGVYSGTSPGVITAYTGAVFMEFRSDCATTKAGWNVSWITTSPASCLPPTGLVSSNVSAMLATISWNAVAGATGYKLLYKPTFDAVWNEIVVNSTSIELTGLRSNAEYEYKVRTDCAVDTSFYAGSKFTTPGAGQTYTGTAGSYTSTSCSGDFYDSGGSFSEYGNYQDWTYTIAPSGATSVTVVFTSMDLENGYDFLKIYDGATTSSSLIGSYTGTTSPGTIVSSGGAITFHFTSDNWTFAQGWVASWTCNGGAVNTDPTTAIDVLNEWETTDFNVSFTDIDSSGTGLQEEFYQVLAYDGTEFRANEALGFFYDGFDNTLNADWTSAVGTWAEAAGTLSQSDEASSNTNLYASVTQGNEIYLYHWQMKIGGVGTNRRAGIHFYCDAPGNTQRGNSYMVYYRVDNNTAQIYKSDALDNIPLEISSATTVNADEWYDCKVIYNSFTGEIKVFQNDVLVTSWTDPSPLTAANSISLRTGNCTAEFDDFKVYKYRTSTENVTVGNIGTEAVQFQNINPTTPACKINTVIIDNTDTWSNNATAFTNIDWTEPNSVVVYDGVAADIDTTYDNTQLIANWTTSLDVNSDIIGYWYQVGTTAGASDVVALTNNGNNTLATISGLSLTYEQIYYITVVAENGAGLFSTNATADGIRVVDICQKIPSTQANTSQQWYSNDFTVNFTDADSCGTGIQYAFYQALDFDGSEWRGNATQGFFNDNFDAAIHSDWTAPTGTWSIDFLRLKQADEALSNTNIYASVAQNNSEVYMYEWDAIMDGAGGNRRGGLHFFCDDPTLTNRGNSYFVWFRVDNNKMQIYKVTNDVFSLVKDVVVDVNPGQQYNNKVIYDPSTGEIKVYRDNQFIDSWTDTSPLTSGNSISLRSGNALMYYDNVKVYKGRTAAETISVGNLTADFIGYENVDENTPAAVIYSVVVDNSELISNANEYFVNIDWSAPATVSVIDGVGVDIDVTFNTTQLTGSWSVAADVNSGINNYWYAIGDTPGDSNMVSWTSSALDTAVTHTGLSLTIGTTYYFSVRATNGAGITATYATSDGQTIIEATAPTASADVSYCTNAPIANVTATDNNGGTLTWYSNGTLTNQIGTGNTYAPSNTIGVTTYYVTETVASNESLADSVKVTVYALPIADAGNNQSICSGSNTTITATGGSSYVWDNGLGAGVTHNVAPSSNTTYAVTVNDSNNCVQYDQVTVSVTALPVADAGTNQTICVGTTTLLSATGGVSYSWDNGLGASQNQNVSPNSPTVYNVTVTDANSCSATDAVTVSVNSLPTINVSGISISDAACGLSDGAISGITATGTGTIGYSWENANFVQQGTLVDLSGVGSGAYKLHVSDDNCSDSTASYTINEIGAPTSPTVTGGNTYCAGDAVSGLTANGTGGTLTWYSDAGLTSVLTTGTTYNPGNITVTKSYYVTETSGSCESGSTQETITVNPLPIANAGTSLAICNGTSTTLVASGGATYLWDNSLGAGAAHNVSPSSQTTYSVTVTQNGCNALDQVTISVTSLPIASAGSNVTICNGQATTLIASGGSSYVWDNALGSGATHVVNPSVTTTYKVTVTENSCDAVSQVIVSVTPLPTAIAGNDKDLCLGASLTLTATGGTSYLWDNGLGSGASHTVSPTVNTTYTVTVTNNSCSATDQVNVSIQNVPNANAGNNQTICAAESALLVASGGTSYSWSNSLGNGNNKTVTPTVTTTYTVTVTDVNSCSKTDQITVSVTPLPTANAGGDKTICEGSAATLTATGGSSFSWSNALGSGASKSVSPTVTTTYTVTVTNNGCVASDQVVVSVTPGPIANAGNDQSMCENSSITITATGGGTYDWSNGLGSGATQVVSPSTTTTYTVLVTNNNCSASDQVTVSVTSAPIANAGADEVICAGETILLTASGGTAYLWDNGLGSGATQSVNPTTNTTYSVTVTDNGCASTDVVNVTVNPVPVANFSTTETINYEPDFDVTFANASQNASSYNWNFGDGTSSTDVNPTHTYNSTGIFTITLTASNGLCADDVFIITDYVEIIPTTVTVPIASFTVNSTTICSNKGLYLTNTSQAGTSYLWQIDGMGISASSTALNPNFSITASGDYSITLTATNGNGSDMVNQLINVTVAQGVSASFTVSDTLIAPNDVITLVNTSLGGSNYCWDFNDGSITCGNNPSVFYLYPNLGDYQVSLILVDASCGNDTATQTIHVVDPAQILPVTQFSLSSNSACEGETITLVNSTSNADSYNWSVNGGIISDSVAFEPTITLTSSGVIQVQLEATNSNGSTLSTQNITVSPLPIVDFVASDTLVDIVNGVVGFTNNSQFGDTYNWSFGDGNTSNIHTPWNDYQLEGYYTVSLEVSNTCGTVSDTKTDYIHVVRKTGIEETFVSTINVYPNPVQDKAIIEFNVDHPSIIEIRLIDVVGKEIILQKQTKFNAGNQKVELNTKALGLSQGVYLLSFRTQNETIIHKLVIQ